MILRVVIAFLLLTSPALAIDFNRFLLDDDDKPICEVAKENDVCPQGRNFTLGRAVRNALYAAFPDEQNLPGDEKVKRAELAMRTKQENAQFQAEDFALMKKLTGKLYSPLIVMRIWELLDPKK